MSFILKFKYVNHKFIILVLITIILLQSKQVTANDVSFNEIIIADNFTGAINVSTTDLDGDGDSDIVCGASILDEISWWENDNDIFTKHIISDDFNEVILISTCDVDKDGDIDVLGAARSDAELAWWENDEMEFTKQTITTNYTGAETLIYCDLDEDSDIDLISTATDDISWWENDGEMNFTKNTILSRENEYGRGLTLFGVKTIDFDFDGDIDLISADNHWEDTSDDNKIFLWQNDGTENFTKIEFINTKYSQLHGYDVVDIDNDTDYDILCSSPDSNTIDLFVNNGTFILTKHVVVTYFSGSTYVESADINDDGLMDFIGLAYHDSKISWFENKGNYNFTEHILSNDMTSANTCTNIDFEEDGDIDIIGVSYNGDIILFENTLYIESHKSPNYSFETLIGAFVIINISFKVKKRKN